MHRNLEHRVEVVAPVEQPQLKQDLQELLELQLSDQRSAWDMQPDGSYVQRMPKKTESETSSQTMQIALAERRCRDANRLRKRKSKAFGKRNLR
jgi:polyphosphate kinase